uniref:tetratricopeptide repeat protein n=1 Tax=uncultured Draconibacterium sp. TaxID=1573823 RepID=UPI003217FAA4
MKHKKKILLIIFLIVLVPTFIIGKRFIAIGFQKQAIELSSSFSKKSDYTEAIEKIDLAIKLAPKNYLFYATKAQILEKQNKFKEANSTMRSIFDFKNDYAEGYVAIAMNYERIGYKDSAYFEYKNALDAYNHRIKKNIEDKELILFEKLNVAVILKHIGEEEKAKNLFNTLKREFPAEVEYIELMRNHGMEALNPNN